MKYAIVIPDGAADDLLPALGSRTPLQAARLPNLDRLAGRGVVGLTNNVPEPLTPASDVATLSLFGYDPLKVYTGRAPLEAAALGVTLGPNDWAIRCNLVHVADGRMSDFTAGHITSEEAGQLINALRQAFDETCRVSGLPSMTHGIAQGIIGTVREQLTGFPGGIELVSGVSYRNLLIVRNDSAGRIGDDLRTQPPHDIPDRPIEDHLPAGTGADALKSFMEWSAGVFDGQPVNQARRDAGKADATQVWLWGQGKSPRLTPFADRHGLRGAITTGVDLVRGVGALVGWDRLEAPGVTDYIDNDYAAQARLAIDALGRYDLVCVHVEAPDEASHAGLVEEKVKALERIDEQIVGPLADALPRFGDWRLLVAPDHRTPLTTRAHSHGAVPFVVAGTGVVPSGAAAYDEATAAGGPAFDPGWRLMEWFLKSS
jgi:2,3-bisphosphoglycerate-independent phosphoglycerate mutase